MRSSPNRVYPRVYGGTDDRLDKTSAALGLSPRVRGNLTCVAGQSPIPRSIPACTGEP